MPTIASKWCKETGFGGERVQEYAKEKIVNGQKLLQNRFPTDPCGNFYNNQVSEKKIRIAENFERTRDSQLI